MVAILGHSTWGAGLGWVITENHEKSRGTCQKVDQ